MKKIPCLFVREFTPRASGKGLEAKLTDKVTPGLEYVLAGDSLPTRKWDGTACMVRDGRLYKRYDAKRGKAPPDGAIPCDEADPVTGHHPHWVLVGTGPEDKWHREAWARLEGYPDLNNGTYELCGPHFSANPEGLEVDTFVPHGNEILVFEANSFESIRDYLERNRIEGIVFWADGEPKAKIRRADFGLPWGSHK